MLRTREPQRRLTAYALAALDVAPVGVAIIDPPAAPILNRAATELLERLADGEDVLYQALAARPDGAAAFSRAVSVTLAHGGEAVLRAHTRPTAPGSDVAVTVLELDDAVPSLRGPSWTALSPREREVAQLVVDGLTDREVADRLVLRTHTVRHHVKRVYQKLDVRSRVELTRLVGASSRIPHLRDPSRSPHRPVREGGFTISLVDEVIV